MSDRGHPLVDPRHGDVLQAGGVHRRVTGVGQGIVCFHWWYDDPQKFMAGKQRLKCYQRWARSAVVVTAPGWTPQV